MQELGKGGANKGRPTSLLKTVRIKKMDPLWSSSAILFFLAYHAVLLESITEMNEQLVAVCKLSNGLETGDEGYVYVSLATLYFPMGTVGES